MYILFVGSIHAAKEDPEQREVYDRLIALKRYHMRHGRVGSTQTERQKTISWYCILYQSNLSILETKRKVQSTPTHITLVCKRIFFICKSVQKVGAQLLFDDENDGEFARMD